MGTLVRCKDPGPRSVMIRSWADAHGLLPRLPRLGHGSALLYSPAEVVAALSLILTTLLMRTTPSSSRNVTNHGADRSERRLGAGRAGEDAEEPETSQ